MLRAEDLVGFKKSLGSSEISLKYGACGLKFADEEDEPLPKFDNPYKKFIRKIRDEESVVESQLNLGRKSGEITNAIIKEFLDWYNGLGGGSDGEALIDHATVQELFQIGFDIPAAQSVSVAVSEMPVIPESLALAFDQPQLTAHSRVKRLYKADLFAGRKSKRQLAFAKSLPVKDRHHPPFVANLTTPAAAPPDQESMSIIWDGIENLWSTVSFAHWLKQHPEVPSPAYFIQSDLHNVDLESLIETNEYFADVHTTGNIMEGSLVVPVKSSLDDQGLETRRASRQSQKRRSSQWAR